MEQNSIKEIERLTLAAQDKNLPDSYRDRVTVLHDNFNLHSLEKHHHQRFRFRGTLKTNSLSDFITYVNAHKGGEGFIDAKNLSATVFFNLGDIENPGHADYTANLGLEKTAPFAALLAVEGKPLNQKQVIEYLEDWQPYIVGVAEDESETPLKSAIAAIRVLKIKARSESETRQENFAGSRSSLEEIEASSSLGLPIGFKLRCEPYLGLPLRAFFVRLAVSTDPDTPPRLSLRIMQREDHVEDIAQEFKEVLLREIKDTTLTIGNFTP